MTCDTCPPNARPVVLIDGSHACSWCEAWRHECEARSVLAMPHVDARRAYLAAVGKRRGLQAQRALEDAVHELWRRRQQARAS